MSRRRVQTRRNSQSKSRGKNQSKNRNARRTKRARRRSSRGGASYIKGVSEEALQFVEQQLRDGKNYSQIGAELLKKGCKNKLKEEKNVDRDCNREEQIAYNANYE